MAVARTAKRLDTAAAIIAPVADHAALREAGFTPDEIWDIGAIAAFFGMSNRLVNAGDIRPNDEFYMLGR